MLDWYRNVKSYYNCFSIIGNYHVCIVKIIKIISILIRALKFVKVRKTNFKQVEILRSDETVVAWTLTIHREIDFLSTSGNSRTWFSENFPKRVLEGWSVESPSGRGRCIRTWQCGQCVVIRTSTRRERSAMAYLLMSITPASMHRQRVCLRIRARARARLRCFTALSADFSISSYGLPFVNISV